MAMPTAEPTSSAPPGSPVQSFLFGHRRSVVVYDCSGRRDTPGLR
ncbi:hypothetical protein AB0K60_05845 [Thermopolyspora sp. NPDC052614]